MRRQLRTVDAAVSAGGGVMRTSAVTAAGYSRRAVERALEAGALVRVRPGWLATRDADPYLVSAARRGVILTCITEARRRGLWVLTESRVHVAVPPHAGRAAKAAMGVVHWSTPPVRRHPDALVDPIENVLTIVAQCQPHENALAIWESALNKRLVDLTALSRLKLPPAGRILLAHADPYADSGIETLPMTRLQWLRLPMRRQIWIAGHRVDLLIGDRLVLQIDGATHVGAQREADIAHDAALTLLGYHVIRVGYWQVIERWHEVQDVIMRAVAQGLHVARP